MNRVAFATVGMRLAIQYADDCYNAVGGFTMIAARRYQYFLPVVLAAVLANPGCRTATQPKPELVLYPAPPASPRVQFLTWASGAEQIEPQQGAFEDFVLGEEPQANRRLNKPYGIAARDGVVYVCDTKGLCIARMDFKNGKYSVFGVRGPGRLKKPINIAIDPLGYKFVADTNRKQIVIYGPDDGYVNAFDVPEPCHPVDVALHGNELYVLDNDTKCRIIVMDRTTGDVLRTFGAPGGEPAQFKIPNSLCVDAEGYVYVSDTHNWRVQKLTSRGESVWVKGVPGYLLGQFGRPRGIRVADDGLIYVVDGATEIVQMFDADGQTLMRFGGPGDIPGALGLPTTVAIDKSSVPYFRKYMHPDFKPEYLIFVASQFGAHLVNVYAFGAFPDGYTISELNVAPLPKIDIEEGIGAVEGEDTAEEPPVRKRQKKDAQGE